MKQTKKQQIEEAIQKEIHELKTKSRQSYIFFSFFLVCLTIVILTLTIFSVTPTWEITLLVISLVLPTYLFVYDAFDRKEKAKIYKLMLK